MTIDLTPSELNVILMICQRADPMDLINELVAVKQKVRAALEQGQRNGAEQEVAAEN